MSKEKLGEPFDSMSDEEIKEYLEDIDADNYLSSIEAHEDCDLPY